MDIKFANYSSSKAIMMNCMFPFTEIIGKVKEESQIPYRPKPGLNITETITDDRVLTLMERCWGEDPEKRPEFAGIKKQMLMFNKGK